MLSFHNYFVELSTERACGRSVKIAHIFLVVSITVNTSDFGSEDGCSIHPPPTKYIVELGSRQTQGSVKPPLLRFVSANLTSTTQYGPCSLTARMTHCGCEDVGSTPALAPNIY